MFGKDTADHNGNLRQVLERIKDGGLTLNKKKCLFHQSSVKFFGFVFSADGLKLDPEKVDYLNNMPTPQNVNELRSLLGMANYSARFINNFASIVAPLRALTKQDTLRRWTQTEQNAFEKLKSAL